MRKITVRTYLYDEVLQFFFCRRIYWFNTIGEAMEYMNDKFPIGENIYSLDAYGEIRCKKISSKYVMYIEIELW